MNLVDAIRPRASAIAQLISSRIFVPEFYYGGVWNTYGGGWLHGELRDPRTILYRRGDGGDTDHALLWVTDIRPGSAGEVEYGPETVVEAGEVEEVHSHIRLKQSEFQNKITFNFSNYQSFEEAFSQAISVALKEKLRLGTDEAFASFELQAEQEYKREFARKFGSGASESRTYEAQVSLTGPVDTTYTAIRRLDRVEREVTVSSDYDFRINLVDTVQIEKEVVSDFDKFWRGIFGPPLGTGNRVDLSWGSLGQLRNVLRGNGSAQDALGPQFAGSPASDGEIDRVMQPTGTATQVLHYGTRESWDFEEG